MTTEKDEGTGARPALFWVLNQLRHYGADALIDPSDACELFGCDDGAVNRDTIFAHIQCSRFTISKTGMVSGSREDWIKHAAGIVGEEEVTRWLLEWEE